MNKKVIIILLSACILVVVTYFFRGPEWSEQELLSLVPASSSLGAVDLVAALAVRPYDEELQNKFLAELQGKEKLPKFEDFPATEFSDNKNIVVDVNSDPIGKIYSTAIRYSVKYNGINFAGKYSIADWGCGSGCQDGVIVDADTGHIYLLPEIMVNGYESRKGSRLLVQNPVTVGSGWMNNWFKTRYWEWTGQGFKSLGIYKVDLEKKEIIKVNE